MEILEEHLRALEQYENLEPQIIKETKVNKLLKVIIKAPNIPRDAEFKFKERCQKLLNTWTQFLSAEEDKTPVPVSNGVTNGKTEENKEEPKEDKPSEAPSDTVPNGKVESITAKPQSAAPAVAPVDGPAPVPSVEVAKEEPVAPSD